MEQKEQVASRPKMTVTVEQDGKTTVAVGENGGICFLLSDDGIRVISRFGAPILDVAILYDTIQQHIIQQFLNDEKLFRCVELVSAPRDSQPIGGPKS